MPTPPTQNSMPASPALAEEIAEKWTPKEGDIVCYIGNDGEYYNAVYSDALYFTHNIPYFLGIYSNKADARDAGYRIAKFIRELKRWDGTDYDVFFGTKRLKEEGFVIEREK